MKIKEVVTEMVGTVAGGIAVAPQPMGTVIKRNPTTKKKKKKSKKS